MQWRVEQDCPHWTVPYLPIDPNDVGRTYDSNVIRINSQSGKGGVGYILQQKYGINMPAKMKEEMGYLAKSVSDKKHAELSPDGVYDIFRRAYVDHNPIFTVDEWHYKQMENGIATEIYVCRDGKRVPVTGKGNGRLDSVSNTLKQFFHVDFTLTVYEEHAMNVGSASNAAAYVGILHEGTMYWGAGIDPDIIKASVQALVVAMNRLGEATKAFR